MDSASATTSAFTPKIQSPSAHLAILRTPYTLSNRQYIHCSPALGNTSAIYLDFIQRQYRKDCLTSRELKWKIDLNVFSPEEMTIAHNEFYDTLEPRIATVTSLVPHWALETASVIKEVKEVDKNCNPQARPEKRNITMALENELRRDGRSLTELTELHRAVEAATRQQFWPAGYDSDADSASEASEADFPSGSSEHLALSPPIQTAKAPVYGGTTTYTWQTPIEDDDDDDDEEDDDLPTVQSPIPDIINADSYPNLEKDVAATLESDNFNWSNESDELEEARASNSYTEKEVANTLKSDKFDWSEESDELDEVQAKTATVPELTESQLASRFFDVHKRELEILKDNFIYWQWEIKEKPVERLNGVSNLCPWYVIPLAVTIEELDLPETGVPTIILTKPCGQICELQESSWPFDGPEWDQVFAEREEQAEAVRERLISIESFDDRIARLEAESYWDAVRRRDWEAAYWEARTPWEAEDSDDDDGDYVVRRESEPAENNTSTEPQPEGEMFAQSSVDFVIPDEDDEDIGPAITVNLPELRDPSPSTNDQHAVEDEPRNQQESSSNTFKVQDDVYEEDLFEDDHSRRFRQSTLSLTSTSYSSGTSIASLDIASLDSASLDIASLGMTSSDTASHEATLITTSSSPCVVSSAISRVQAYLDMTSIDATSVDPSPFDVPTPQSSFSDSSLSSYSSGNTYSTSSKIYSSNPMRDIAVARLRDFQNLIAEKFLYIAKVQREMARKEAEEAELERQRMTSQRRQARAVASAAALEETLLTLEEHAQKHGLVAANRLGEGVKYVRKIEGTTGPFEVGFVGPLWQKMQELFERREGTA